MKLSLVALMVLMFFSTAKADEVQNFDVTGMMQATGYSGVTETLSFAFTIQYVPEDDGTLYYAELIGPISVQSMGPLAGFSTTTNRIIGDNSYIGFFDPQGDEFDLGILNPFEQGAVTAPAFFDGLTKIWGCQSQACETAFEPPNFFSTDLPDSGNEITSVVDPVIETPEPSLLALLACGILMIGFRNRLPVI